MIFGLAIMAIMIGILMPVQAGLNAELTRHLRHPYLGAFISLTIGAMLVSILVLFNGSISELKRLAGTPPHLYLGGIMGALFVGSSLFLIPKMGATAMVACFISGQLVGSVIIDHYGLMGLNSHPLTMGRLVGIAFLFIGLLLVLKKPV